MKLKIAEVSDIEATLKLHAKDQIDTIKEEDKKDGFVITAFTKEELTKLIREEHLYYEMVYDTSKPLVPFTLSITNISKK